MWYAAGCEDRWPFKSDHYIPEHIWSLPPRCLPTRLLYRSSLNWLVWTTAPVAMLWSSTAKASTLKSGVNWKVSLSSCVEHRGNSRSWQVRQGCERDAWLDLAEKQKRTPTCNDGCSEKHLNPWCVETALLFCGKESRKRPFLWSEEVWKAIDKPMEEEEEEEEVQVHSYWVWTFCQALRVISRRKKKSERRRIKELVI